MKTVSLLFIAALLLTGCVSRRALSTAIDEKIAANNVTFVQPMMAQQNLKIDSLEGRVAQNALAISKSKEQVSAHRGVLIDHYKNQQERATTALQTLAPEAMPVKVVPAPIDAIETVPTEE